MAIKHQRYHLAMRKFPSHRVPEGGRGLWGDSACPDVTLLPRHITGPATFSRVLSHLPSSTSKNSSVPKARCKGIMAKETSHRARRFYQRHSHSKTRQSTVTHLLSHSPAIPYQLGEKRHRASPSGISHGTDYWVTRPARSGP